MFNCSYFDKSILNVYSPMSPKMFLGPAVGQQWPNGAHPNGVHPNGAHPNSAHPMVPTLSVPNLTMPTLTVSPLSSWWPLVTPGKLKCLKVTKSLFKNEEKKIKTNWKKVRSNGKIGILRPAINVWRPNYKKGLPFLRFKLTTFHSRLANLSIQLLNFLYKWCL